MYVRRGGVLHDISILKIEAKTVNMYVRKGGPMHNYKIRKGGPRKKYVCKEGGTPYSTCSPKYIRGSPHHPADLFYLPMTALQKGYLNL